MGKDLLSKKKKAGVGIGCYLQLIGAWAYSRRIGRKALVGPRRYVRMQGCRVDRNGGNGRTDMRAKMATLALEWQNGKKSACAQIDKNGKGAITVSFASLPF